jgi:serine kinase of HPr protein (carbohydrate metabolism regulator)
MHATAVVIGEAGILIRGASGSGKSALALSLLALARERGASARLVGDDWIELEAVAGRLIARGKPAMAGRIEHRGAGVGLALSEPAAVLRLIVDLIQGPAPRMPEASIAEIAGINLPGLVFDASSAASERARSIMARLIDDDDAFVTNVRISLE